MNILKGRRAVIYCEGCFGSKTSKVAASYLRYCGSDCVAVIDSDKAGQRVVDILGYGKGIPIISGLEQLGKIKPDVFMIGFGLFSNVLPSAVRESIKQALLLKMDVVSGLHFKLADDPELSALAHQYDCQIWDTKEPSRHLRTSNNRLVNKDNFIIHTVGSDCRVGKKTTALEIAAECRRQGISAVMAATGQSGMYITGNGIAVDAVPADFIAGASEDLVLDLCDENKWILVEGQGAISHPAYSGVTLGLLHGVMPQALVLCHQANLTHHKGWPDSPLRSLSELISMYEQLGSYMRKSKVVAISVNCEGMGTDEAEKYLIKVEQETGLPATDVILFGASKLVKCLHQFIGEETQVAC
ncbi:DUF1611 domain-containing protein [uncultured Shewanella sp.]|uniref:DUF1611 domain-containing protein n=1 Tax=uncultured Shewanella sp. TaxID=173975 RepID=UPI002617853B|nr:DUF1611 domain-containing protein [uncultured Shewanella sp.]